MTEVLERMLALHQLKQCDFSFKTVVLATAIQRYHQLEFAQQAGSMFLAMDVRDRLERLFPIMKEISLQWPSTDAILRRFQGLLDATKSAMHLQSGPSGDDASISSYQQQTPDLKLISSNEGQGQQVNFQEMSPPIFMMDADAPTLNNYFTSMDNWWTTPEV